MEKKVKLMCSYGGRIQPRPHDHQLSYINGHTKILTINREDINFSNLQLKLHELCDHNYEIQIKYKLPGHDFEALISVFDDDDVDQMIFEYDLLRRVSVTPPRFRLFLFFPVTAKPVAAAGSLNPDFLFGFDKEYSFEYSAEIPENSTCNPYIYPPALVYRSPENAGGCFEAGLYSFMETVDQGAPATG